MSELLLAHSQALVFHGTWQEVLPLVKTLQISVTITDPPYSSHVQRNIRSVNCHGPVKIKEWQPDFDPLSDYHHVPAFLEVTDRWVLCFCDLEAFGVYRDAAGGQRTSKGYMTSGGERIPANKDGGYIRSWVWRKRQAAPQLSGDRPANSCEGIAVMHSPGQMRWNGRGSHAWSDLDQANHFPEDVDNCCIFGRDRAEKRHEAQKPAALCEHLIEKFSEPGERIADWYCGSGAIPAAAIKLGRTVVACDQNRKWAEFTAERLRSLL